MLGSGPGLLGLVGLKWEPDSETAENFLTRLQSRYSGTYESIFYNFDANKKVFYLLNLLF